MIQNDILNTISLHIYHIEIIYVLEIKAELNMVFSEQKSHS